MRTTTFTLPWPPSLNRLYRTNRGGRGVHKSDDGKAYEWQVAAALQTQAVEPAHGAVRVSLRLYRPERRGDIDNFTKVLLDCLQTRAYMNDNQICELHIWRYDDKQQPRVEVEVTEVDHAR